MIRRATGSILHDTTFYVVVVGYLCEIALLYLSFSQVPEQFLHASHEMATLQASSFILPSIAILLLGLFQVGQSHIIRILIRRYAYWMIGPSLFFFALSIGAGHAFIGAIALAILSQWAVLIIGITHVWITLRRQ